MRPLPPLCGPDVSCWSPAWDLCTRNTAAVPRLSVYHRHTHGHQFGHSCGYTDSLRQGFASSSLHIQDSHQAQACRNMPPPPLGQSEAESHKCSTHTTLSRFTNTPLQISLAPGQPLCLPSTPAQILELLTNPTGPQLTSCIYWVLTVHMQHSHTCSSGWPHSWVPQISALPCCLPDTPTQTWGLPLLAGPAWSLPVNPHKHTMHSWLGQGTQTLPQKLAFGTWDVTHSPDPALSPSLSAH